MSSAAVVIGALRVNTVDDKDTADTAAHTQSDPYGALTC